MSKCVKKEKREQVVETASTRFDNTLYGYFIGKRIAFPVVEYYVRNNWGKYGLNRIMMNSKGFFFFQFTTLKGLEDVLENGPWMICNSPIILKKWSMNTRLCKEELTSIPVWVKIHDVLIHVFSKDGLSIVASQIASPPTAVTSTVVTPTVEKTNDEFQMVGKKKKKKGKSKSTNGGQFAGPSIKKTFRYEPKATISAPKKGAITKGNTSNPSSMLKTTDTSSKKGNITTSNSYSALDDKSEEDVENVYDESANLFPSTNIGGSSSFMATDG
nr:zinc knuckle CX2CX4HX4C [Tanacetum cinerariifolium]